MSASNSPGDKGAGAGLSLASPASRPDGVPLDKTQTSLASRALALSTYFFSGALAINISQFLGTPLYLINSDWYNAWIAFTKQSFGLLTTTLTQRFSPTTVIVSGDASVRGQILQKSDGTLLLNFPERIVLIANHQIYTDWLYLWWAAYCSGMHGRLYIILKESLKKIPVLGWGMQFSQFIFLKRNWEKDQAHMAEALQKINKPTEPMWLLLFPEGTNLAANTRQRSAAWAEKNSIKDMRHCLLPRSTGLRFCLQQLQNSTPYLYDCTIAYEAVPRGSFAQDIFTLKAGYVEGRPPKSVSMYWRRFAVKDIPIHNEKAFDLWLIARWREKDLLIENYLIHGRFPADSGVTKTKTGQIQRGCGHLNVPIRSNHWYEFLQIFAPMGILAMVLGVFYGALPQKLWRSITDQALNINSSKIQSDGSLKSEAQPSRKLALETNVNGNQNALTFDDTGHALANWLNSAQAKRLMNNAETVQAWLENPGQAFLDTVVGNPQKQKFLQDLKQEETRRKRLTNPHQGTFWNDIATVESSRNGSIASTPVTSVSSGSGPSLKNVQKAPKLKTFPAAKRGTFWSEIKNEESKRDGSSVPSSQSTTMKTASDKAVPKLTAMPAAKKNKNMFWSELKSEELSRNRTTTSSPLQTPTKKAPVKAIPKLSSKANNGEAAPPRLVPSKPLPSSATVKANPISQPASGMARSKSVDS